MFLTLKRTQHCLSLSLRSLSKLFMMGVLVGSSASFASASSTLTHFVNANGLITNAKQQQSVQAQSKYLLQLANKQIRAGEVEKGKALLQQVLMLDPQNRKAQQELTKLAESSSTGFSPSSQLLAQAGEISVDEMSSTELVDAAKAMMRDGDYGNAERVLTSALAKSTNDQERRQIRSYLTAIGKDRERAQQSAQLQLDYNLSELDKQLKKAVIYIESGDLEKAEVELQRAKMIAPNNQEVNTLLARIDNQRSNTVFQRQSSGPQMLSAEDQQLKSAADVLFEEGVSLYRQGHVLAAWEAWDQALDVYQDHQPTSTYMANTRLEYEAALADRDDTLNNAIQENQFEKMLDTEIPQYSTQGERVDVKDVYSLLSTLSGLNLVLSENLEGQVAMDVKDTTVRGILNLLQKQYGFVWDRDGDTIFVNQGFQTRVFPLTEGEYKTIEQILSDPSSLEDSSRNLRTILYGPNEEFDVPGKQLHLSRSSRALVVTDTQDNLRQVEAFLKDMPTIIGTNPPVETRVYKLDRDIAQDIYEIIKLTLYQGRGAQDVNDPSRKLFLEPESNTLIVIDYPNNINQVEQILSDEQVTRQLEEGDLTARQFSITDVDDIEDTPEAYARREEFVSSITQVLEQMLYGREGRDAAVLQGRRLYPNPERGTIDIVDTKENIRRVEEYLSTIRGESTQEILIEMYPIDHVDVYTIADALAFLFFDAQQSTRPTYLSQNIFQSIGTSEQADNVADAGQLFEETTRNRFNLTGGGGGGTDLLQFFSVRFYPDVNTNSIVVFTPDQEVLDLVSRVINTFDKPHRMIELESRIVTVNLSDLRSINFDYMLDNPLIEPISFNPEFSDQTLELSGPNDGLNLSIRTFGESRLDFIMNLLESTTSLNLLSAPKVLSVANPIDPPRLFVGQQIPYADQVDFEDQGDDDPTNNRLVAQFERTLAGVTLAFIPFILNDDHIYLELAPQIVEPGERLPVGITGTAPPGQEVPNIGPLLLNQKFVQTSVRMKNGSTVVLGGLIDEKESESRDDVPFFSKIPFFGGLFSDRQIEKTKNSTLIFVTAKIIEPDY